MEPKKLTLKEQISDYLDNHLIEDWRKAYKMLSMQINTIFGIAVLMWPTLTLEQQQAIMATLHITDPSTLVLVGVAAIFIGRLKSQNNV